MRSRLRAGTRRLAGTLINIPRSVCNTLFRIVASHVRFIRPTRPRETGGTFLRFIGDSCGRRIPAVLKQAAPSIRQASVRRTCRRFSSKHFEAEIENCDTASRSKLLLYEPRRQRDDRTARGRLDLRLIVILALVSAINYLIDCQPTDFRAVVSDGP